MSRLLWVSAVLASAMAAMCLLERIHLEAQETTTEASQPKKPPVKVPERKTQEAAAGPAQPYRPDTQKPIEIEKFRSLMNAHIRAALWYMTNQVSEYDRYFVRFISFYDVDEIPALRRVIKFTNWWNNQMSFDEYHHLMAPVPGTGFRLFAIDLRDYRWNSPAWYVVASREPRFRQPWVQFREAEELRREAGYYDVKPGDDGTTPAVVVVSGTWLLRDTLETNRDPSYYDLLFAEKRFVMDKEKQHEFQFTTKSVEHWPGGVDPKDGKFWKPGDYTITHNHYRTVQDWKSYTFVDFPRNDEDLEECLGVDKVKAFAKKNQIDIDNGAIVAGGRDDPQKGSIVALQNRLIAVLDGPLGPYMETFDTKRTSGLKDYSQALIFAGRKFRRGQGAKAVKDAGEILFYLRNGGQGGILVDGQNKRIELAAGEVANDTSDPHLNPGVRTYGSCATCHSGGGGYVPPDDLYAKWKENGIKLKFYDREQANRVQGFFSGLNDRLESATKRYQRLTDTVTQPFSDEVAAPGKPAPKAWTGADAAAEVLRFRGWYDEPVDAKLAAREMGIPVPILKWLAVRVGPGEPNQEGVVVQRDQRAKELVRDMSLPRSVWDDDVMRQIGLALDSYQSDPDFLKLFDLVQVPPVSPH